MFQNILVLLAVVFLLANALGKLPSWPWGLTLLLLIVR